MCSVTSDSATPRTAAYQAPRCIGFSRQEYWIHKNSICHDPRQQSSKPASDSVPGWARTKRLWIPALRGSHEKASPEVTPSAAPTFASAPPRSLQRGTWVCHTGDIWGQPPQQRQELGLESEQLPQSCPAGLALPLGLRPGASSDQPASPWVLCAGFSPCFLR